MIKRGQLRRVLQVLVVLLVLPLAVSASPTFNYGDKTGANFDFTFVSETVQTADDIATPEWEDPSILGGSGASDILTFSPSSFLADSQNDGSVPIDRDETHSTFRTTITAREPGAFIDNIILREAGDGSISSVLGGFGQVEIFMGGTLRILDTVSGNDEGTIFNWGTSSAPSVWDVTFSPGANEINDLFVVSTPGAIAWSAVADLDLATVGLAGDVLSVEIAWNNELEAATTLGGSADVQKKAAGTTIEVIPEPSTALLVAAGLLGLAARRRTRA